MINIDVPLLSVDIGRHVLMFLDASELAKCSRVCKTWNLWIHGKKVEKQNTLPLSSSHLFYCKKDTSTFDYYDFDENVSIDNNPIMTVLRKPNKSLLKWRIRMSGIPSKYRYNFWRYQTELDMRREGDKIMHRQPGIFELFVDQPPSPGIEKVIMDDISLYLYIKILNSLKLIEHLLMMKDMNLLVELVFIIKFSGY